MSPVEVAAAIGVVSGAVLSSVAMGSLIISPVRKALKRYEAVETGLQYVLFFRLSREVNRAEVRGAITASQREIIVGLYKAYSALGGNGYGTDLKNKALNLPLDDDEMEEKN